MLWMWFNETKYGVRRWGRRIKMKQQKLIEIVKIDCPECKEIKPHSYIGDFGVPWKPVYVYSCKGCGNRYQSLDKIGRGMEWKKKILLIVKIVIESLIIIIE